MWRKLVAITVETGEGWVTEQEPDTSGALEDLGVRWVGRFEWERWVRRCRLGFYDGKTKDPKRWVRHATVQQVAFALSTYADLDGTRVRPSIARMAMVCDLDERTVRVCVKRLRQVQLLELVAPHRSPGRSGGPGRAAEFRMSVPYDLLELVAHLDPDEQVLIVPEGVDVPPERKPRKKAGQADEALWISDGVDPVDNS